jgi:hypothetical protein
MTLLLFRLLTFAVGYPTLRKIVRCQFNRYAVAWYDSDEMLPHLTCDVSYDLMAVLEFDAKLSSRKGLNYRARKLNDFFTPGHKYNSG